MPVAEVLALLIRNNVNIKGFIFKDTELKLCQLADDTTIFLQDNNSLVAVLKTFEEFYRYAGLKLNKSKTEAIILGKSNSIIEEKNLGIKWCKKPFKTLGIWFSLDSEEMVNLNLSTKLSKMQSLLNMWSSRCLSLKGKITLLKSLIMPHILHIASVIPLDHKILTQIENMFYNFLWNNKKHGISKKTIIQAIEKGGLKMVCISNMIQAAKIMWLKRLLDAKVNAKWKHVSWFFLDISLEQIFSKLNTKVLEQK